ncbi:MAG: TIGR00730 family Rossman fold protein [Candidatus Binatia bacterium]
MSAAPGRASGLKGSLCVFTGSRRGRNGDYARAARQFGRELAERGYGLVYGGGNVGLMNVVADTVLEYHGTVTGVIPETLVEKEVVHRGLSDLRVVRSMHERKALMAELSDGFVALPGGIGTMEEFFEVLSWAQLGIHNKPCGLLNVAGYYSQLIRFVDYAVEQDFLRPKHRDLLMVESEPGRLLDRFEQFIASQVTQRFDRKQT